MQRSLRVFLAILAIALLFPSPQTFLDANGKTPAPIETVEAGKRGFFCAMMAGLMIGGMASFQWYAGAVGAIGVGLTCPFRI